MAHEEHRSIRALDRISARLDEHTKCFDSLDAQLKHVTQMVHETLRRLPEPKDAHSAT